MINRQRQTLAGDHRREDGAVADLRYANLAGASLRRANLAGAVLDGVNLRESDLQGRKFEASAPGMAQVSIAQNLGPSKLGLSDLRFACLEERISWLM